MPKIIEGDVIISRMQFLKELPDLVDVEVNGRLVISRNKSLSSLKGCPRKVNDNFNCESNGLTGLVGCPQLIGASFCCDDNHLESLTGCPKEIPGAFLANNCGLKSFVGGPEIVGSDFYAGGNAFESLDGFPREVGGHIVIASDVITRRDVKNVCKVGGDITIYPAMEYRQRHYY